MKTKPQRMCVVCREMKDKQAMVRVVLNDGGDVCVDETGKAHGRGAYVCAECENAKARHRALERALKKK